MLPRRSVDVRNVPSRDARLIGSTLVLAASARAAQLPVACADALFALWRNIDHVRSLVAQRGARARA